MKRRLLKLGLLLLVLGGGGAIVNVAVAWGFALFAVQLKATQASDGEIVVRPSLVQDMGSASTFSRDRNSMTSGAIYDWRGWPSKCMKSITHVRWEANGDVTSDSILFGIVIKKSSRHSKAVQLSVLPLFPLFPGFAINTIFYAAVLWVVWFTPGMVRRRIRRRRGL